MILTLHVLLSEDARGRVEARVPFTSLPPMSGRSAAQLLDELTLKLMEAVPKMAPPAAAELAFRPRLEIRRVKVELTPESMRRADAPRRALPEPFAARVAVCLTQWASEDFFEVEPARLPAVRFALRGSGALGPALARVLSARAQAEGRGELTPLEAERREHLELIEVPVDLPSPLPSARPRPKKRPKSAVEAPAAERRLVATPHLSEVATGWTHRALDGRLPRAHRREALVAQLEQLVDRPGAAVLLVGPSGAGKTALVLELAHRLAERATSPLDRRDLWRVDANRIIAGMSVVGAWEERVAGMIEELSARQDVLFVEDLPALVFAGRSSHGDANVAEVLDPHLARGELRVLGACSADRLEAVRAENPGFFARFRAVRVPELSERETLLVLAHMARAAAARDELVVTPEALEAVLGLTRRFEGHAALPGRAARLLERVLADGDRAARDEEGRAVVGAKLVVDHYAARSGLPPSVLRAEAGRDPSEIRAFFARQVVGQPEAVAAATDLVLRIEQGLADPGKPFGSYLFVGPTGVGKTETAKALARLLFGGVDRLLRLDMSEFQTPWSVTRLFGGLGAPDGELTRQVAERPFSVILLDEIEKAHPSVFDALLQVLGEGRLTNAAGHTVSFRSAVVIMTSNLGVRDAERRLGFGEDDVLAAGRRYREAAEAFFRPELFNRIDRVVPFRRLTREVMRPLTERLLAEILGRRGLAQTETVVEVDPALPEALLDRGFDPKYGARSMRRTLEQELAVPLAEHLLTAAPSGLTIVALYVEGSGVGLDVRHPRRAEEVTTAVAGPPQSWAELEALHERLQRGLRRLTESEAFRAAVEERSALLDVFNRGEVSQAQTDTLNELSAVVESRTSLEAELDAIERSFAVPRSESSFVTRHVETGPYESRLVQLESARPARFIRGALSIELVERAKAVDREFLRLRAYLHARMRPDGRSALVLVESVGISGRLLEDVDRALDSILGFRELTRLRRAAMGWSEGDWDADAVAGAFVLHGPDAVRRAQAEVGLWVRRETSGLGRGVEVLRVTELGDPGERPLERLAAWEQARPSPGQTRPEPELEIVRWLEGGVGRDPATGVALNLDKPRSFELAWLHRVNGGLA